VPAVQPEYIWGPPRMATIRRCTTRLTIRLLVLDTARGFTSEASSAVWDGAVGLGRTGLGGSIYQNYSFFNHYGFRGSYGRGGFGRPWDLGTRTRCTGWEWHTPIEGWPRVTAVRVAGLAGGRSGGQRFCHAAATALNRMEFGERREPRDVGANAAQRGAPAGQLAALRRVWSGRRAGSARRPHGPAEYELGPGIG